MTTPDPTTENDDTTESAGPEIWAAVDEYLVGVLQAEDAVLSAALAASELEELPAIQVSPLQGKLLMLLGRMVGARRILEVGTLGGYSTIWLARASGEGGRVITLEIDPHHARVARANLERAGVADRVDLRVGPAADSLRALIAENAGPFDLVFLDADKPSNPEYLQFALQLSRPGTVIIADNVVRSGGILDPDSTDPAIQGTRHLHELLAADPRVDATVVQTVGARDTTDSRWRWCGRRPRRDLPCSGVRRAVDSGISAALPHSFPDHGDHSTHRARGSAASRRTGHPQSPGDSGRVPR